MTEGEFIKKIAPLGRIYHTLEYACRERFRRESDKCRGALYTLMEIAGHDVPIDYYDEEYVLANTPEGALRDGILRTLRTLAELREADEAVFEACMALGHYDFGEGK